jgi:amino-acid N-acetyltransferase
MNSKAAAENTRTQSADDARLVAWVRQAAPYIHAFRGRTFVIAFGGEVLQGDDAGLRAQA